MEYKEKLWLGTDGGLIIYNPKDESYEYCPLHVPRSVTNNEVKYIQKEGDHLLWISIYYCGLYLYDMETRRIIKEIPDFPYNQVRRIAKGTDNIYWIALGVDRTAITVVVIIPAIPTPVKISGLCFTVAVFTFLQILVKLGFCISVYPP